ISPDLHRIVWCDTISLGFTDFDNETGTIKNVSQYDGFKNITSLEFSPNGQKLFVANGEKDKKDDLYYKIIINQYNVDLIHNKKAFLDSKITVAEYYDLHIITDMQISPDDKIYVNFSYGNYLGIIENPDSLLPVCKYYKNGIYLQGKTSSRNFPYFVRNQLNFWYTVSCRMVSFQYIGYEYKSTQWLFGDGATSAERNPTHTYAHEGTYTVTLTVTQGDGTTDTISKQIEVFALPTRAVILYE
ncbi:MAG: PKD domain-containing protein, partial [Paludibacteraceae bacterium]|nr:PKD domain-containing protein [Paludibacteraceae bacterium]